jgi:hypothetical protein
MGTIQENIQDALLGIPMVGFDEVVNNQKILELTKPKEKKFMGTDFSLAARSLIGRAQLRKCI